jgi:hypothetical protein
MILRLLSIAGYLRIAGYLKALMTLSIARMLLDFMKFRNQRNIKCPLRSLSATQLHQSHHQTSQHYHPNGKHGKTDDTEISTQSRSYNSQKKQIKTQVKTGSSDQYSSLRDTVKPTHHSHPVPEKREQTGYDDQQQENFISYFNKVLFAPGEGPLNWALRLADQQPLRKTKRKLYDRFVSMAGWLQLGCGENDIFLPQRKVCELLGVSGATISNMTHCAISDGYLKLVKPAIPQRRAALYRFNIDKFPVLRKGQ